MRNMPWQDIYSRAKWNTIIDNHGHGQMSSTAPRTKKGIGIFKLFSKSYKLPLEVSRLDQQIRQYHTNTTTSRSNP